MFDASYEMPKLPSFLPTDVKVGDRVSGGRIVEIPCHRRFAVVEFRCSSHLWERSMSWRTSVAILPKREKLANLGCASDAQTCAKDAQMCANTIVKLRKRREGAHYG